MDAATPADRNANAGGGRSSLGLVFLIVFLDIVGFSVLFPLFPAMLDHYVALEGPESWCGRLVAWLTELADSDRFAVVTLFGTVLGSIYSLLQFLCAPLWGALSDRNGRRPVLLVTLAGTVAAHLLWVFAGSFALLIVARLLAGAMAGNVSTASAVAADTTTGRERAKGMGIVGMAIGLGFIFGPVLGWLGSTIALGGPEWTRGLALNPFSAAAAISLTLGLVNLIGVATRFRETLPPEKRGKRGRGTRAQALNPLGRLRELSDPGVSRTSVVYFLFATVFAAMEFTLTFLAVERFAYDEGDNAGMFVYVGLIIAFVNGGVVRRLAPRLGEKRLVLTGLVLLIGGFLLIGRAGGSVVFHAGLGAMAVGSGLAMPCLSSLVSRYTPDHRQGYVLGTFRSLGTLSRAVGPLLGGVLYWSLGSAAPYYGGAVALLLPLLLAVALPPAPVDPPPIQGSGPGGR